MCKVTNYLHHTETNGRKVNDFFIFSSFGRPFFPFFLTQAPLQLPHFPRVLEGSLWGMLNVDF